MAQTQVNYSDYLQLEKILKAQTLESEKAGRPAHDEMLFIIVHQAYELWFKQILFEMDSVLKVFSQSDIEECQMGAVVARLSRINEILSLLNDQVRVLETMTPLDFLDFRDLLTPASGFQSHQFRLIEIKLGLVPSSRLAYQNQPYQTRLSAEGQKLVQTAETQTSLLTLIDRWLSRTPFLDADHFNFIQTYKRSLDEMLAQDRKTVERSTVLSEEGRKKELEKLDQIAASNSILFDERAYQNLIDSGQKRLSHRALIAALFINVYRDMPILHLPFQLLTQVMNIDEHLTTWRTKHALMVHRMVGNKIGTGGSSGFEYLRSTIEKHKVFGDLFDLSTLYIPRSKLPALPENIRSKLGFLFKSP